MTMTIDIDFLAEPKLQFGAYFEHEDTKTGLAEFGPFGKNVPGLHPSEIKVGFIGTRETVFKARAWIERCGQHIESENVQIIGQKSQDEGSALLREELDIFDPTLKRLNKIINRDFSGFNKESTFQSSFQTNSRWERIIDPRELQPILQIADKVQRIWTVVDLIEDKLASISEIGPVPDIVVIALTPEIEQQADVARVSGNFYLNLRRALKARAMKQRNPIPIQLVRWRTLEGKGHLQEIATRAWNFCTAQYYKSGGIPWRPLSLEADTCYVGISFYVAQDESAGNDLTMRSSTALAFDFLGQGLVLRGDQFLWNSEQLGSTPHLSREAARKLIKRTLEGFIKIRKTPPRRVVIHKSSSYWGSEHPDHNELDGFYEGIDDVYRGCETDFVALQQTGVRLFREGLYPPLRGTIFSIENDHHFLYTMGYVPYLETYPKPYVPEPWQIVDHHGGSAPKEIFQEVLALTKMNVNNCAFADGEPITISFSNRIGEIFKHVPSDGVVQSEYRFYM